MDIKVIPPWQMTEDEFCTRDVYKYLKLAHQFLDNNRDKPKEFLDKGLEDYKNAMKLYDEYEGEAYQIVKKWYIERMKNELDHAKDDILKKRLECSLLSMEMGLTYPDMHKVSSYKILIDNFS